MPYDALTYVISEKFNLKFSKAKISSDLINVCVAGAICLIFIQSLGSIGIGTLIAALFHRQNFRLDDTTLPTNSSILGISKLFTSGI